MTFQRSQSFYGRSASAGPLTRTRSFPVVRSRDSPKKEQTNALESPQKLNFASVSPLRFSPRHKKKFSLYSLLATSVECDQKKESLPRRQKPTTPTQQRRASIRSSPRLLKKRSFSCIGFSSVPFPEFQTEKDSNPSITNSLPFDTAKFNSPVKDGVFSDAGFSESSMRTPKKENLDTQMSKIGIVTPKSKGSLSGKRTPSKDYEMDECVVLLTPIRNPLKSPVHVSPKVMADTSPCLKEHSQPLVIESSKNLDRSSRTHDENFATPIKNIISPAVRSSPRLVKKREISEYTKETSGESSCKAKDSNPGEIVTTKPTSVILPNSTRDDSANPRSPLKDLHLDECVVLLTPIRGPLTSPVHRGSQDINTVPANADAKSSDTSKSTVNNSFQIASPTFKSPRSSPRFSTSSSLDVINGSAQASDVSEQKRERLSLKPRKKSPMSNNESTRCIDSASGGTQWSSEALGGTEQKRERLSLKLRKRSPITSSKSRCISSANEGTQWSSDENSLKEGGNESRRISSSSSSAAGELSPVPQFKSPRSSRGSPVAIHLLLNQPPQNSTPPPKKGKKKPHGVSNSPAETKRSSPLNQILRQQKRKRCFSSSPADKSSREAAQMRAYHTPIKGRETEKSTQRKDTEELGLLNVSCPVVIEDNNSRSSEDVDDWLTEMQKEFDLSLADENEATKSPPTKKRRIHKSVVFGGKRSRKEKNRKKENTNRSLSSDTSFEEDDEVFQSPAVTASCLRRRRLNKTPLSANSIKVLQESPILCNSKLTVSPSSRTRSCSDLSPNSEHHSGNRRLSRRKFVDTPSHDEARVPEAFVDDLEEPIGFSLRKRLKLNT